MCPLASNVFELVPARASHIRSIAGRMRGADRDEVGAITDQTPLGALMASYEMSTEAKTALVNGHPEIMLGVVRDGTILSGRGVIWLLGTDAVVDHARDFLRISRPACRDFLSRYPIMWNYVDERNVVAWRWLEWLGADIGEPFDIRGHRFARFELRAENV